MADLVFKQGLGSQINGIGFTKTSDGVLSAGGAVGGIQNRDVVKISYPDNYQKAVYAICTDFNTGRFEYDENIYPVDLSSFTATVYPYLSTDVHEVDVYRIGVDIQNGLYSNAYIKYASDNTYTLRIPASRNEYFSGIETIVTQPNVVFADYCDNKAYGVGFTDGGFDLLNNRFKSTLEFNIATR